MIFLIYAQDAALLVAFQHGHQEASGSWDSHPTYSHGVDDRGPWLLIEARDVPGDNQTYELTADGLVHTDTGVVV